MCSPSATLDAGSLVTSGVAGFAQAAAQRASLRMEARTRQANALLRERDADFALYRGQVNAARAVDAGRRIAASQRAAFAANNVTVGVGAAAQTEASTMFVAAQTADDIELAARREAMGLRLEASNERLAAVTARAQSRAASPALGAVTSFIGTLGSMLQRDTGLGALVRGLPSASQGSRRG